MAGFISVMNAVLRIFLREFVAFEKHHTITRRLASAISKMWLGQFFNVAIIIYLINARYEKLFNPGKDALFLAGKYTDFSGDWYGEVGAAIAITTFITSVFPIINIATIFVSGFKRCCDRSCRCDPRRTKQLLQRKYEALYMGPRF